MSDQLSSETLLKCRAAALVTQQFTRTLVKYYPPLHSKNVTGLSVMGEECVGIPLPNEARWITDGPWSDL